MAMIALVHGSELMPWLLWNVNRKSGDGSIHVGSDDLEWPVTRVSRSLYCTSWISQKRCFLGTKLL